MSNVIRVTKDGVTKDFASLEDAKKEFPDSEYLVVTSETDEAKRAIVDNEASARAWRSRSSTCGTLRSLACRRASASSETSKASG